MKNNRATVHMQSSTSATHATAALMVAALMLASPVARSERADSRLEGGVAAHLVRLVGHGGDNEVNRKNLITTHHACVVTNKAFGRTMRMLAMDEVPAVISPQEVEIYYAANRTLTLKKGSLFDIDRETCGLTAIPHHTAELRSSAGRCHIDLIKKQARGQCDTALHTHAAHYLPGPTASTPTIDLDKVPPHLHAHVLAHLDRLEKLGAGARVDPETDKARLPGKTIAALPCDVHRNESVRTTLCIAKPVPSPGNPVYPFPIPAAPLNADIPGILLEARTPAMTLQAELVQLNIVAPAHLFSVPADFTLDSSGAKR